MSLPGGTVQEQITSLALQFGAQSVAGRNGVSISIVGFGWNCGPDVYNSFKITPATPNYRYFASIGEVVEYATGEEKKLPQLQIVERATSFKCPTSSCSVLLAYGTNRQLTTPVLTYDEATKTFNSDREFTGLIQVPEYYESFKILKYTPRRDSLIGGGVKFSFGWIAAYDPESGAMATAQCPGWSLIDDKGNTEFEVYNKSSKMLINTLGAWEYPDTGWPEGPCSYSDGHTPVPDPVVGIVTTRVHEVGMADITGRVWIVNKVCTLNPPFDSYGAFFWDDGAGVWQGGAPSWKPTITTTMAPLPSQVTPEVKLLIQQRLRDLGKPVPA